MNSAVKEVFVGLAIVLGALCAIICTIAFLVTGETVLAHVAGASFVLVLLSMIWVIV